MNGWVVRLKRSRLAFAPVVVAGTMVTSSAAAQDFLLEEGLDFTGNGCESTDLNDVTGQLHSALLSDSRTGQRYVNGNAWPQDFIEACSSNYGTNGLDNSYADARRLSVYAGHGHISTLFFSHVRSGRCVVGLDGNMRLGRMAGASSVYAMYATSCTLNLGNLSNTAGNQLLRQQFGFHNSPIIANDDLGEFYRETNPASNRTSWLDNLEDRPGWFTGDNSPLVRSAGENQTTASSTHNNFYFRGAFWQPAMTGASVCHQGLPYHYWYYTYINHGGC